jgi:endonuclease YncB( thermonuclease family)
VIARLRAPNAIFYRYSGIAAVCRTESGELNAPMVRCGWAVDYTKYSGKRYRSDEEQLPRQQIWAGRFEIPWK